MAANLLDHKVSENPALASRTDQSGSLVGVFKPHDDLRPAIETLLTDVVKGLRRDWLVTSAHRWGQLYPISEVAHTGLEKDVTTFVRQLFCRYSQLVAGLEMYLLQLQQGGVVRQEALLRLQELVIHFADLDAKHRTVSQCNSPIADLYGCPNCGHRTADKP
ncbi:hypothetical protein [Rhodoferax aquaticus]|uniref:Uncharacterized protein n=1 Tax=Rhodoferax aquaticus TaxID=2527691 RepID=A0A515ERP3_9BURK|nr:hypothetical protein [Rhodoferax aquaticus]QDL55324.1 hypothetical protein EXZ61_14735 [Rhodoferax aquaticus]